MNLNNLLLKYNISANPNMIMDLWREPQRYYHGIGHLGNLLDLINKDRNELNFTSEQYEKLLLVAYFHDIIYDPTRTDNEEESAKLFLSFAKEKNNINIVDIHRAILDTKTHTGNSWLSHTFNKYDMDIVNREYDELLEWEDGIRKEYKHVDDATYKIHRLMFIDNVLNSNISNITNLQKLKKYIQNEY